MRIIAGDLEDPQVVALLRLHVDSLRAASPPGASFALDLSELRGADLTLLTAWDGDALLGCGALKELSPSHGELKSMRTAPAHTRKGVSLALLDELIGLARTRGYRELSLETGAGPAFEPALALYRKRGFCDGPAFAAYVASPFSQFLHLQLG